MTWEKLLLIKAPPPVAFPSSLSVSSVPPSMLGLAKESSGFWVSLLTKISPSSMARDFANALMARQAKGLCERHHISREPITGMTGMSALAVRRLSSFELLTK
jgi:hypothetical protein